MKGIVFTTFNDMVEEQVGINCWEEILESIKPEPRSVYTSVVDFPDNELFAMITKLSTITGQSIPELIKIFGQYLFHVLAMKYSVFIKSEPDFISFLKSIEDVIHKEVEKLYTAANLPTLQWEQNRPNSLTLYYRSPRKLCHLADGLIRGAAEQYEVSIEIAHEACMHNGHDHCKFEVSII